MALEIERKFLLNKDGHAWVRSWLQPQDGYGHVGCGLVIGQGYLSMDNNKVVRVRHQMDTYATQVDGYVTKKTNIGLMNTVVEDEYRIPPAAAEILLDICQWRLAKTRWLVDHHGNDWELDVFTDEGNKGLLLAELEFKTQLDANIFMDLPPWVGKEVTEDFRYKNSNLTVYPWNTWAENK